MTQQPSKPDVSAYMETLCREINEALDIATRLDAGSPPRLTEAIRYSLLSPGKRLRPMLTFTACEMAGGDRQRALPAACAVEMVHTYSLIHDDLPSMDDDDLRRGQPTCHKQFDEPTAVLAGDALLALAFEMIADLSPPELIGPCCKELALAAGPRRLVGGQMDDITHGKGLGDIDPSGFLKPDQATTLPMMERIHIRKTGALMQASLLLGGLVGGMAQKKLDGLDSFGLFLGLAFQISDDLLDVMGDEVKAGKRLHKDAKKEKFSYPTLLGVDQSRIEAKKAVRQAEQALEEVADDKEALSYRTLRYLVGSLLDRTR